jgi:hypothetical protein
MNRIALAGAGIACTTLGLAAPAHADVMGSTDYVDLPLQHAQCVIVSQQVRCGARFQNVPPEAIPPMGGFNIITVTSDGAVSWGYGTSVDDSRAVGERAYQMPMESRYHIGGWTVEQGNGAVVTLSNDATGHGLKVEGADSLPPIMASGF